MSDDHGERAGQPRRALSERKPALHPKRRRAPVENVTYVAFLRRALTAYGRRVGDGAIDDLAELARLADDVDAVLEGAVAALLAPPHEYAWGDIARALGITRQAAMTRWPSLASSRRRGGQPARLR